MFVTAISRRTLIAAAGLVLSAAAIAATPAPPGTYKIDSAHSVAYFELGHLGGISRFMGRFNDMSGDLVVDTPAKSTVKVEIKTGSIDTKHDGLDKHLRSPDFFNAVQFPTMSFSSTALTLNERGEGTVSGNLSLLGVTKPVTLTFKQIGSGKGMKGETRAGYVASGTIKRTDFGMGYGVPGAATDEVELRINIEAIKQ